MFNEYEKLRMRQNPMLQPRMQPGGRNMPAWFAATLVNPTRVAGPTPPPPPLPSEPPPEESDYEEIDHLPKNSMKKTSSRRACSLCGNPNPAVSCEMCNDQIFCGSCNDMYHRHPKRQHHSRKILEPLDNRPPLPPKTPVQHEMMMLPPQAQLPPLPPSQQQSVPQPVPPPRRKGRFGMRSATSSPTSGRKSSFFDPVGTLKRFVGGMAQRPLPSPPKNAPPLPPKPTEMSRAMTPTMRAQTLGDRRLNSPQMFGHEINEPRGRLPGSAFEMHNARTHSISVANLSGHTMSRDSGYPDWEEDDEEFFARNRAHSVSGGVLGRYPSTSHDAPHFATLHRPGRTPQLRQQQVNNGQDPPERPPPPLPPRQFPSNPQLAFQSSQSAFDLDRMAAVAQQQQQQQFGMSPWNYPMPGYPFEFQQAMMMGGYPGTMHRTPSTQSMGPSMNPSSQPGFFGGWGPMGFGPPMTQMEMDMMANRRGSEQFMNQLPHQQPSQRGVPHSNPVTPQGSFRKKTGRHMSVEPELTRRLDRVDLTPSRRSGTPSSFVRVPPSTAAPIPNHTSSSASSTPAPKSKPPAKPPSDQSPDDSYFSAERQQLTESGSSESTPELTENPEGPWECEHCTFINPKSTKVCTICCKTPADGYKPLKGNKAIKGKPKKGDAGFSRRRESSSRKDSTLSAADAAQFQAAVQAEEVPVLKSKLSISREKQQAKINLVSQVEKERVKPSKSSLKAGSSGTLKAGQVPPGHKLPAATAPASKQVKKKIKTKVVKKIIHVDSDDEEENDEEEEERAPSVELPDDEEQAKEEPDDDEEEEEDDDNDDEEDEDEETEDDADDEEAEGVVNVKITAGSSHIHKLTSKVVPPPPTKPMAKAPKENFVAPSSSKKVTKLIKGRTNHKQLVDSNEDVYGSVPIQALAISPKIEIRRSSKSKISTGTGHVPPESPVKPQDIDTPKSPKPSPPTPPISTTGPRNNTLTKKDNTASRKRRDSSTSKSASLSDVSKPGNELSTKTKGGKSSQMESLTSMDQNTSVTKESSSKTVTEGTRKSSISTGMQTTATETVTVRKGSSSTGESETGSSSPFQPGKDIEGSETFGVKDRKSSVGTSPPPQSISTQTYEDAPSDSTQAATKSGSKTSLDDYDPPKPIEMSEKAMRYARKARNKEQHYQKLKRSMSTHLTYPAEAWMDSAEGRHLYRSSSRQSLASDTRSLPLSGPPSRESSPPPMRNSGVGGGSSRWYEDFRRFPPPAWDRDRERDRYPMSGDYFSTWDDHMPRRRRESMRSQDFELTRMLKDAEEYSPEDIQVAIRMCGEKNPIKWLQENWLSMIETVQSLATKYGREKDSNDVGTISNDEAKDSLRANRGNVWAAVTDCVDQRRKKFNELQSRGQFARDDVLTALTVHHGNMEAAYVELSKAQLKPFLMRIWGSENESTSATITNSSPKEDSNNPPPVDIQKKITVSNQVPPEPAMEQIKSPVVEEKVSLPDVANEKPKQIPEAAHPPHLETLVSNAEKVTQEIEKAIQELKSSGAITTGKELKKEDNEEIKSPNVSLPTPESSQDAAVITESSKVSETTNEPVANHPLQRQKSESESEHSSNLIHHVKSDGEDESFADAMSESASNANSPPPSRPPPADEAGMRMMVMTGNEINVDDQALLEDEFDEDVLEIEIDDSEANISEFIQNYEILPAKDTPVADQEQQFDQQETVDETEDDETKTNEVVEDELDGDEDEDVDGEGQNESGGNNGITKGEIEQLLTTLTSTFSEMEQFAYKIKENIATEIQQQLAAAASSSKQKTTGPDEQSEEDGSYEPIALPPGIEANVNKKMAKYHRLAAKKKEKVGRHKSPETRAFQFGMIKEASASPSPSTSLAQLTDASQGVLKTTKDTPQDIISEDKLDEKDQTEVVDAHQGEDDERHSRFSDYEEVEIGQADQEQPEEEDQNGSENEENGEGEFVEEDVNESSIVEESDEDIAIEAEEELDDFGNANEEDLEEELLEEDDNDGNDNRDDYANIEITPSNITPSDLDKVIVAGGVTTPKPVRNNSSNNNAVVILAEELTNAENQINLEKNIVVDIEAKTDESAEVTKAVTPSQRLINDGKVDTLEQAELALQLLEMKFSEDDSFCAAKECSSLCSALSYLQQECDLCTGKFCAREMVSMLHCKHICCRTCARDYFTVQVRDKSIVDATCPFCGDPSTLSDDSELATEYFNHLDILLKNLLDSKYHEMFQRKLRDWTLAKTPNFKWCSKCSSGFITEPMQTRLVCPDCRAVTCAVCLEPWDKANHDHRDNTGSVKLCDTAPKSIIEYMNANCIECPRCHFRFSLARGGCMHLTCSQCHHEFCSGCSAPFRMGNKCEAKFPICDKLGLHAHHPRNCLFYLRDKEAEVLSKLLEENAIPYFKEDSGEEQLRTEKVEEDNTNSETNSETHKYRVCQVPIQKETSDGFADDICGKPAPEGYATVCKTHYIEYLGLLIWQNHLDPITILTNDDLEVIVRRAYKKHPGRPNWLSDEGFRKRLLKVINEEIPL